MSRLLAVPAGLAVALLAAPLLGLLARAPWAALGHWWGRAETVEALRTSLLTASGATLVCVVLGVPLAAVLTRVRGWARRLLRVAVLLPLILPPVVGGVALLLVFGRGGLLGAPVYRWWGVSLPFTPGAVVLAQVFVGLPFLVLAVEGALRAADRRVEDAAATLGAGPWTVFRRVTVPLVAPGVLAGAALSWARAVGEFGATITFAGNVPGRSRTVPVAVYLALETDPAGAVALSLLLLGVCAVVLVALRDRWWGGLA
ncbi:molybdate ABC transporter permease [Pilimelia terevasa]|uniref:Molybdenum transport system permease n=1 Tax=Pilimelia terevasa TaxID=53372 RepID=A0A8J3FGM0_9ACTN|nr:ABC transporter permease [Pilimelia terevasa]GGK17649.1 molybdate ABC transporter permease [Pilimelia terevasa]